MESSNEIHCFTSVQKLDWFGPGAWVNEPDEVSFSHAGLDCKIRRVVAFERDGTAVLGHLCGYVKLPLYHPWIPQVTYEIDCGIHGGLTFKRVGLDDSDDIWVGFDCAHSGDIIPSNNKIFGLSHFAKEYASYKNMDFVREETKKLAEETVTHWKPVNTPPA